MRLRDHVSLRRMVSAVAALALVVIGAGAAWAWQPSKPITIIVPAGPGGGSDQFVRNITQAAERVRPGVKFVVENITGGGGAAGFTNFMGRPADGHVFISVYPEIAQMMATGVLNVSAEDIVPVMRAQNGPATLLRRSGESRFKDYDGMIRYMKEKNAELTVATYTLEGFDDLTLKAIEEREGVRFKRVPYVKAGERFAALLGGHVDLLTQRIGDVMNFIENKQMEPVIVGVDERIPRFRNVPTMKDKGIEFPLGYWRGIWAKRGTPPEAVAYLDELLRAAMEEPGYVKYEKEAFYDLVPGYMDAKTFRESVNRELAAYRKAYAR